MCTQHTGTGSDVGVVDQSLTSTRTVAATTGVSDTEDEMDSEPESLAAVSDWEVLSDSEPVKEDNMEEVTEGANYRETMREVRSFRGLHQIPDLNSSSSSHNDNPFAGSRDTLRHWKRSAREQTYMCNEAAGLSRRLTKVQDAMVAQLQTLQLDKGKDKAPERSQQAVDELDYLVTFNRSITQAMARTMQDLSEGIFVNMANLTLARRDSYMKFLQTGVKQDTVSALCTAPLHSHSLSSDQLLVKAEE